MPGELHSNSFRYSGGNQVSYRHTSVHRLIERIRRNGEGRDKL
jgi:hypothetical protein